MVPTDTTLGPYDCPYDSGAYTSPHDATLCDLWSILQELKGLGSGVTEMAGSESSQECTCTYGDPF